MITIDTMGRQTINDKYCRFFTEEFIINEMVERYLELLPLILFEKQLREEG